MSITGTLSLTVSLKSNTSSTLSQQASAMSLTGTNGSYSQPTIGTSPVAITLPVSPLSLVYVRNLAPAGLATPASAPTLSSSSGGALLARTYYAKVTWVNALGETLASAEASLALNANTLATVTAPASIVGAAGWNLYASTTAGSETKQNSSPIAIGSSWTEPTSGLISGGAALPSSNTTVSILTVTWTPQGGTSAKSIDLVPQGAISLCEPTSAGGYTGPTGTGGITALTLTASQANTPAELILAG